jgi:hypothetical protein
MKTSKLIITALLGFFINAASAENFSAGIKYASDYFYRGALKSSEAVQSNVGFSTSGGGIDFSAGAFTNQAVDSGVDTYILSAGASKSFADDLLSVYGGVNHVEDVAGVAVLEAQVSLGLNWHLSPTVNVYRDLDDALYTYELVLGHDFDLKAFTLGLNGSVGHTDVTSSVDNTYYTVGASATRALSDSADLELGVVHVDSDTLSNEYVFEVGVSLRF